jgi:hypothetical protein
MQIARRGILVVTLLALSLGAAWAGVKIGEGAKVAPDSRQHLARFVIARPGDGKEVILNPPRFSWPYRQGILMSSSRVPADTLFTLQISEAKSFDKPYFQSPETDCNFYNFIPELKGATTWHWRVGYRKGKAEVTWTKPMSFILADNAVVWDRSGIPDAIANLSGHPRILFKKDNLEAARALRKSDEYSAELYASILRGADAAMKAEWYRNFPSDDSERISGNGSGYMRRAIAMLKVVWARKMSGDEKYTGYKENFLKMAAYPPGGKSAPEGMAKNTKWNTHLTEYIGLFYDWCYDELTPEERTVVRDCLEWRIDHTLNSYAWRRSKGKHITRGSIAVRVSSHPYENSMTSLPGALAIADESEVARKALEIWTNYVIGITNGMGPDEGWNEGPGYGNGKMKWLTDAMWYLNAGLPETQLGKNSMLKHLCDFLSRITPLGARHSSFGNRGKNETDWCMSRITNMRRVAVMCNDGEAMQNWLGTRQRMREGFEREAVPAISPWIDYFMPLYAEPPAPTKKANPNKLFALEGWVTVSSAPPSDCDAQKDAVSMTFACRPRGGYSHAFRSENGFDIHAYGETIAVGGGTTSNQSWFANHTMSHNTVLVNGMEQVAAKAQDVAYCGRVIAYEEGDNYVYWAGDATAAYGLTTDLDRFVRHVLFVDSSYFVIYDDLQMAKGKGPGTFQWLYHILDPVPLEWDATAARLTYTIGETNVTLQHVAHVSDLAMQNRRGKAGMVNPITGDDTTVSNKWAKGKSFRKLPKPIDAHHLWFSHKTPRRQMNYLAVIAPSRKGETKPVVTPVSDTAVRVSFRGKETTISFGKDKADIAVDTEAVMP